MKRVALATALVLAAIGTAGAQGLPAACTAGAGHKMSHGETTMSNSHGDAAHQMLMAGMDRMNADMMAGGTAEDIDVAFACSMIPHHRGAIDMAKAVLAHGDDSWVKALAEQIIAAQEKEIAEMEAWLAKQPQ
jgi:uncharacterized protein (DUF305 family)